jgi:carbonic anhydrase/acetyltransferase-like protein (isoleucine patch superfamily)
MAEQRQVFSYKGKTPQLAPTVFLAPGAVVAGDVEIGEQSSIWFNAVVRGDMDIVRIGKRTNVQDNAVLHVDTGEPLHVGDGVTIGHGVVLHGCTIKDGALIGMGATVLNGAVVGEQAIIGAGALVTEGKVIPPRTLAVGVPARVIRELSAEEIAGLEQSAQSYINKVPIYRKENGF